jgi:hypothetical protein
MEHGRLIEMGQLTTVDSDGTKTEYKMALVIEFASVSEIKQAIEEGQCTFGFGDGPVPND